jgi:hypothetical protein
MLVNRQSQQNAAARTLATVLVREVRSGVLNRSKALKRCSECNDPEVGSRAWRLFNSRLSRG